MRKLLFNLVLVDVLLILLGCKQLPDLTIDHTFPLEVGADPVRGSLSNSETQTNIMSHSSREHSIRSPLTGLRMGMSILIFICTQKTVQTPWHPLQSLILPMRQLSIQQLLQDVTLSLYPNPRAVRGGITPSVSSKDYHRL